MGSSAVLHEPPVASMELGSSKVNVGTAMTGSVLFTSVSNALTSLCPTPTASGAWTSCQTGTIKVGDATWLDKQDPQDGTLTIHVTDAQYNSTDYLNLFIQMVSSAANASATGSNCQLLDWVNATTIFKREITPPEPVFVKGNSTFCNMNGFLDTQFYNGIQETAQMWLETEVR